MVMFRLITTDFTGPKKDIKYDKYTSSTFAGSEPTKILSDALAGGNIHGSVDERRSGRGGTSHTDKKVFLTFSIGFFKTTQTRDKRNPIVWE